MTNLLVDEPIFQAPGFGYGKDVITPVVKGVVTIAINVSIADLTSEQLFGFKLVFVFGFAPPFVANTLSGKISTSLVGSWFVTACLQRFLNCWNAYIDCVCSPSNPLLIRDPLLKYADIAATVFEFPPPLMSLIKASIIYPRSLLHLSFAPEPPGTTNPGNWVCIASNAVWMIYDLFAVIRFEASWNLCAVCAVKLFQALTWVG